MAAELAFETSAQSTGQTILPELPRSLVTFRFTAYMDKGQSVSQSVSHLATRGWVSRELSHKTTYVYYMAAIARAL